MILPAIFLWAIVSAGASLGFVVRNAGTGDLLAALLFGVVAFMYCIAASTVWFLYVDESEGLA